MADQELAFSLSYSPGASTVSQLLQPPSDLDVLDDTTANIFANIMTEMDLSSLLPPLPPLAPSPSPPAAAVVQAAPAMRLASDQPHKSMTSSPPPVSLGGMAPQLPARTGFASVPSTPSPERHDSPARSPATSESTSTSAGGAVKLEEGSPPRNVMDLLLQQDDAPQALDFNNLDADHADHASSPHSADTILEHGHADERSSPTLVLEALKARSKDSEADTVDRQALRRERNKQYARRARAKQKTYITELEAKVDNLTAFNHKLVLMVQALAAQSRTRKISDLLVPRSEQPAKRQRVGAPCPTA